MLRALAALGVAAAFAIELLGLPGQDRGSFEWGPASRQADKLIAAGRFADALPVVVAERTRHPSNANTLRQLARTYAGLNRLADEAAAWEAYLTEAPATDDVCLRLSEVYRRLLKPDHVAAITGRCLPFDPHQPELRRDRDGASTARQDDSQ
jgi:hypothetical protein